MEFSTIYEGCEKSISQLFTNTFSSSEGPEEGAVIGELVERIIAETLPEDIYAVTAWDNGDLIGGIFFTRLKYSNDARKVFLMAPVAVATARQGQRVGSKLIKHGLDILRADGVDIAVTYGDPAYYGRLGFTHVSVDQVPSPMPLQMPQGWLAQGLRVGSFAPLQGKSTCVQAFDNPALW